MKTESFTSYMSRVIEALENEERYGTAYIYGYALKALQHYRRKSEISFTVFNKTEMKHLEHFFLDRGRSWNTVSTYFRALRTVYNRAVDDGIITGEFRLFNNVFTGVMSDKKLALDAGEMHALIGEGEETVNATPVKESNGISCARDLLTLMLLLQGIGFADLIHL